MRLMTLPRPSYRTGVVALYLLLQLISLTPVLQISATWLVPWSSYPPTQQGWLLLLCRLVYLDRCVGLLS